MFRKKRKPVRVTNYVGTYRIEEDSSVYTEGKNFIYGSMNGEKKHIGTLVGFVPEEKFHKFISNAVKVDDMKNGISKEPQVEYTMIIRRPKSPVMPDAYDIPIYEIRITKIEYL